MEVRDLSNAIDQAKVFKEASVNFTSLDMNKYVNQIVQLQIKK